MAADRAGGHAVVIGASVAGLLAARVLRDRYARVTIVERDTLPGVGQGRRAIPQGRHAHVLLASGQQAIEELLPGITRELLAAGAQPCASLRQIRFVLFGHELCREAEGAEVLLASRPLLEGHIRRRVLALDGVTVRERSEAVELLSSRTPARVTGVRCAGGDVLNADLVVAASGRSARVSAWLEALGCRRPAEDELPVDLRYASRRLRLEPGALGDDRLVGIAPRPGLPRGLMLIAQEDHWILTLSGYGDAHRPPSDERGFLAFAASVGPPDVVAAIDQATPLGEIATHGFPANRRRRYDRLRDFPDGLLVTGDAISSFNPLYGQGMSVAALEARALRDCLAAGDRVLARRFFRASGKVVAQAWDMAVGADLALPEVAGHRSPAVRLSNAYVRRVIAAAERDPVVAGAYSDVGDLLAPPGRILAPPVALRVLRATAAPWSRVTKAAITG